MYTPTCKNIESNALRFKAIRFDMGLGYYGSKFVDILLHDYISYNIGKEY